METSGALPGPLVGLIVFVSSVASDNVLRCVFVVYDDDLVDDIDGDFKMIQV